ncbi:MAG: hypothetical protein ACXWL5_01565 [Candidatus Chromulinivorax sp.]
MKTNYTIFCLVLMSNQLSAIIADKGAPISNKTQTKSNSASSTIQNIYNALPDVTARGVFVKQNSKYQDINTTTLKDPNVKTLKNQNGSKTYELANKDRYTVYGNNLNQGYFTKATYSNLPARTISDTIRTTRQTLESAGSSIKSGTSYVAKNIYDAGIATGNAIKTGVTYAGEGLLSFGNKTSEFVFKPKTNTQLNTSPNNTNTDWKNSDFSNLINSNNIKKSSPSQVSFTVQSAHV